MPGPGRIFVVAEKHRQEVLTHERAAASAMVRRYGQTWQRLQQDLGRLQLRMQQASKAGEEVSLAWLYQEQRYRTLLAQVEREITGFATYAEQSVLTEQAEAIAAARRHTREMATILEQAQLAVYWNELPVGAVEEAIGFMRPTSPLHKLLSGLAGDAVDDVEKELVLGVSTGLNPRVTARRIREALGGNLARALTISRTETLRAYREATRQSYLANSQYVSGWMWLSAKSPRTCAACIAMDGTIHRLDERLDDHPCGRCVMAPVIRGAAPIERQTGAQWFALQDETTQRRILGNAGYEAYRNGEVRLTDFVGRRRSADWGTMRYARSLRAIRGRATR